MFFVFKIAANSSVLIQYRLILVVGGGGVDTIVFWGTVNEFVLYTY